MHINGSRIRDDATIYDKQNSQFTLRNATKDFRTLFVREKKNKRFLFCIFVSTYIHIFLWNCYLC